MDRWTLINTKKKIKQIMDSKVTGGKQDVQIKWGGEASLRR